MEEEENKKGGRRDKRRKKDRKNDGNLLEGAPHILKLNSEEDHVNLRSDSRHHEQLWYSLAFEDEPKE